MTRIKYILLSSLLLQLIGCKKQALEVGLDEKVVYLLQEFSKDKSFFFEESIQDKTSLFYELSLEEVEDGTLRLQVYLVEYQLNDYLEDFKAHSKFNGYDVVIYGDLNSLFYKIDKSKKSTYVHKYGSSDGYIYDPPYWNLYFDKNGKLIRTSPKEVYDSLTIEK